MMEIATVEAPLVVFWLHFWSALCFMATLPLAAALQPPGQKIPAGAFSLWVLALVLLTVAAFLR